MLNEADRMTNSEDPDQTAPEQSDQGLHCFVSPICPNTKSFTVYNTSRIMHNILREKYFDMVSESEENISMFLDFFSNWLRLITLCENITLFWSCS